MRRFLSMAIASALLLLPTVTAQTPAAAAADEEQVRQTLSAFWKALGDFDGPALKATLDWPNMIVQSRPDKGTRAATANTDMAAYDEEMRRTMDQLPKGAKGDFYGSTIQRCTFVFSTALLRTCITFVGWLVKVVMGSRLVVVIAVFRLSRCFAKRKAPLKKKLLTQRHLEPVSFCALGSLRETSSIDLIVTLCVVVQTSPTCIR